MYMRLSGMSKLRNTKLAISFKIFVGTSNICVTTINIRHYFVLDGNLCSRYILSPPPQKKNTIGIWVSIAKEPFMESEKSKPDYETMPIFLQFSEDPI